MSEQSGSDKTTVYDKGIASPIKETQTKMFVKTIESHAEQFAIDGEELTKRFKGLKDGESLDQQMDQWQESITAHQDEPRYEMKELLGQGAQGLVFGVQDKDCGREIALKTMRGDDRIPTQIARFVHEVQVTAQLEHPGIVPVHDLNVLPDGTLFYTMKKIQGRQLSEEIQRHLGHADSRFRLLQLFLKVCDTMSFAHSHGVLHRDLKPSNIMIGDYGEVLVVDWGLSKVMNQADVISVRSQNAQESDSGIYVTREGHAVGTPAYMSPEQAMGHRDTLDQRSDIYSLGVILYEMLSKSLPYTGLDVETVLDQVAKGQWVPINKQSLGNDISPQLAAVVHKAMAHDPKVRYRTVDELALDLNAYLAGESVTAYADNLPERILRFMRKNQAQVKTGLILSAVFLIAVMSFGFYLQKLDQDQVNKWRTEAFYYLTNGLYDEARNSFKRIIEFDNNDYLAKDGLKRANKLKAAYEKQQRELEAEGRKKEQIEEAGRLLVKAQESTEGGKWVEALKFLNQAYLLLDEEETVQIRNLRLQIAQGEQKERDQQERAVLDGMISEVRTTVKLGDMNLAFTKANAVLENLRNDKFDLRNDVLRLRDEIKLKLDTLEAERVEQKRREDARRVFEEYQGIIADFNKQQGLYEDLLKSRQRERTLGIKPRDLAKIDKELEVLEKNKLNLNKRIITVLSRAEDLDPRSEEVRRAWADHYEREVKRYEERGDETAAEMAALFGSKYDTEGRYRLLFKEKALVKNLSDIDNVVLKPLAYSVDGILSPGNELISLPINKAKELNRGRYIISVNNKPVSALKLLRGQSVDFAYKVPAQPNTKTAMSYIAGGFVYDGELRRTDVYVSPFWMARYEITCGEYLEFLNSIGDRSIRLKCAPRDLIHRERSIWRAGSNGKYKLMHAFRKSKGGIGIDPKTPVYGVNYNSVLAYIEWRKQHDRAMGKAWRWRLPTEHEWRLAAQSGDGRVYPWGDKPELEEGGLCHSARSLQNKENERGRFFEILLRGGSFPFDQNVAGVYDLGGSLAEFVDAHNQQNQLVMICGGSFQDKDDFRFRTTSVRYIDSSTPSIQVGFRLVLDLDNE